MAPTIPAVATFGSSLYSSGLISGLATGANVQTVRHAESSGKSAKLLARWGRHCVGYFEDLAREEPVTLLATFSYLRPGYLVLALDAARRTMPPEIYSGDVLPLLEHRSPMVREAAVYALASVHSPQVAARLARIAEQDPSPAVREAGRNALE